MYLIGGTGRLLISEQNNALVIRLNSDGSLDKTYGDNGFFIKNWGADFTTLTEGVIVERDLYVVGMGFPTNTGFGIFAKIDEEGALDNGFGINGRVLLSSEYENVNTIAQQNEEHILIAASYGDDRNAGIARFDLDGNLDGAFGQDGLVVLDFGEREIQTAMEVDPIDNGIYVAGYTNCLLYTSPSPRD